MIEIKLTFPTLEAAISAMQRVQSVGATSATAVVTQDAAAPVTKAPAPAPKPKAETTASPKGAAVSSPPATAAASPASSPAATTPPAAAPAADGAIPYSELQKAVFSVAQLGAEAKAQVLAVAADLGAATFKELPADVWPAALERVKALHAGLTSEVA